MSSSDVIISHMLVLVVGIGCGFGSSAPIGPINLWYINTLLAKKHSKAFLFLVGVLVTDIIFALLAVFGLVTTEQLENISPVFNVIGSSFMLLLGIGLLYNLYFYQNKTDSQKPKDPPLVVKNKIGFVLQGVLFCALNPGFFLFWLFAINQIESVFNLKITLASAPVFLIGVLAGDALWFYTLFKVIQKKVKQQNSIVINCIRYTLSIALIAFGIFGFYQMLK